jgi:tRNA modification GTPase
VPVLHVTTKADLLPRQVPPPELAISAVTGLGLDELRSRIAQILSDRAVTLGGEMLALTPRHRDALAGALDALREARSHTAPELAAQSMRRALDHLGDLAGHITADDIIGRIFATFCIGK